jgi:hypothetical protein
MTSKLAIGIGLLGLVSLGCNASTMIGEVPDGSITAAIGAGGSGMCTPPVDPKDQAFTPPAAVAGTWTGYFQGSNLPVGQDAIKLTIDQGSDGSNQIHIVLGSNPPPPPATDAFDTYPTTDVVSNAQPVPLSVQRQFVEGFTYPAHEVQWLGQRLKFVVSGWEAWDSWCLLQQSFKFTTENDAYTSYNCVPGIGISTSTAADGGQECDAVLDSHGTTTPVDCDQVYMCQGSTVAPCQCDACGCSKNMNPTTAFDITFDGDLATGTGGFGATSSLRLTRATN